MTEKEALAIYEAGPQVVVKTLLEMDRKLHEMAIEIQALKEEIALLRRNSTNSSKPPSTDSPKDRIEREQKKKQKKSKRKPGGQTGHKGVKRELKPVAEVDKIIECYSSICKSCKEFKNCKAKYKIGMPERFQQTEVCLNAKITEFQLITLSGKCGETHKGILPVGVEKSCFGPRLTAIMAYFTAVLHVSRRKLKDGFKVLFDVDISLGSTQNLLEEVSDALEYSCNELEEALPNIAVINADETGWYKKSWLWVFVTTSFIFFHVAKSRASDVLEKLIGDVYNGILCVDRFGAYTKYHKGLMQICWAHLDRDIEEIRIFGVKTEAIEAVVFAEMMAKLKKKMMSIWYEFKECEIDRQTLIKKTANIRLKIIDLLNTHTSSNENKVKSFAKRISKRKDHLFTFIFHEEVEPTNNVSERSVRPAVQWKKVCFGNRSEDGAQLTSRLLTATRTCWLQGKNALDLLVDTITCYRNNLSTPSLLNP